MNQEPPECADTGALQSLLVARFAAAIARVTGQPVERVDASVRPATDPQFGDYQCNAALQLARALKAKPRDVALRIKDAVEPDLAALAPDAGVIEPLEIAGPGFLNIRFKPEFLARRLDGIGRDQGINEPTAGLSRGAAELRGPAAWPIVDRVGLPVVARPRRVVVEYSQPNVAKQMHVGHLRSTIIGDVFARVLAFQGHEVIRQNHIGDWGTQFGMLIRWYREYPLPTPQTHADVLEAIEADYKAANERFGRDEQFAAEARRAVAELQGGDPAALRVWEQIRDVSLGAVQQIYDRLGVLLRPEDVRGESFYNAALPEVVRELRERGADAATRTSSHGANVAVRDDAGAVVVYLYDDKGAALYKNADGEVLGMIIQKSDGAYLYATTDLAAIRYRLTELPFASGRGAERVVYVTDARQKLHFEMFIAAARAAGWIRPEDQIDHVTFGTVLGEDRRPLKTRAGGTIKLRDLLDEAEKRAHELIEARVGEEAGERPRLSAEATSPRGDVTPDQREVARRVGIGAVKYADLRNDRNTDYVFSWDKMLSLTGNTAPYMLYAYARIRSIYRKAAERFGAAGGAPDVYAGHVRLRLAAPAERALALRLARLPEIIDAVAADLAPHTLCAYLYDLAADFMRFYETCPVLQATDEPTRLSRMRLCDLTARTLKLGLALLGIDVLERM